jgi:phage terminase large subunit GpA-like protein
MHAFQWANVKWVNNDPATARLHCPKCDHGIDDAERVAILARGMWLPEHPERRDRNVVSFHLWEAYSPLSSLAEIVAGFLRARALQKRGDNSEMHTWQNTTLGEPIEADVGEGVEPHSLLVRREERVPEIDVPAGACCLTMGVDGQDDRLEALVFGWGPGEESWLIDRHTLPGDTSQPEPWAMLDELLDRQYRHAAGPRLMIHATCIDSGGHRTHLVYDYALRKAARRVYAIIGRDGQRPIVSSPSPKRWGRQERQVPLYTIGVDAAKSLFISRLALTEKGPGYVHLPWEDWCDEELAAQLTSERPVTKWSRGVPEQSWIKIRARNEALDMANYALGALRLLNPKLGIMLQALQAEASAMKERSGERAATAPRSGPPASRRLSRSSYLGR